MLGADVPKAAAAKPRPSGAFRLPFVAGGVIARASRRTARRSRTARPAHRSPDTRGVLFILARPTADEPVSGRSPLRLSGPLTTLARHRRRAALTPPSLQKGEGIVNV